MKAPGLTWCVKVCVILRPRSSAASNTVSSHPGSSLQLRMAHARRTHANSSAAHVPGQFGNAGTYARSLQRIRTARCMRTSRTWVSQQRQPCHQQLLWPGHRTGSSWMWAAMWLTSSPTTDSTKLVLCNKADNVRCVVQCRRLWLASTTHTPWGQTPNMKPDVSSCTTGLTATPKQQHSTGALLLCIKL
jgi:hypothetical protein